MRFIETKKLNDFTVGIGAFPGKISAKDLPARLASIDCISLQEVSLECDREFLREVSSVLSVIASIIHHPHISNKREEVVIRIEQAQQLSREDFFDTVKDSKLWKEHDARMIPEEVHYQQHIDELRIYENRFIGFLVNVIDRELAKFSNFYLLRLPTLSASHSSLDPSGVGALIVEIDRLRRRTQFIKNTYFYKEVTKGKPISHRVQPTNILVKDRLYRFCFKFYRKLARYEDSAAVRRDLCTYYTILLLDELQQSGFAAKAISPEAYLFENETFALTLETLENHALSLTVTPRDFDAPTARHLLDFHVDTEWQRDEEKRVDPSDFESVEMLSLWERSYAEDGVLDLAQSATEEEMIRDWLHSKIQKTFIDPAVYKRYCPVCGKKAVSVSDGIYSCAFCTSRYQFDETGTEQKAWLRKIRKKGIS